MLNSTPSNTGNSHSNSVFLEKKVYTTGQAEVEFTKLDSTYDHYYIEFFRLWPSVDGDELRLYAYSNGAWQTGVGSYSYNATAASAGIPIAANIQHEAAAPTRGGARGRVDLYMYLSGKTRANIDAIVKFGTNTTPIHSTQETAGVHLDDFAISGIRFKAVSGDIEGEFRLYGVIK